jgi:S1-C subfamily serine protease
LPEELRLRFISGPRKGQEVAWPAPRVRIGRSRDNDILLPERDGAVSSAHHAEAHFENGTWWIVDLGSTNGTLLNGHGITRQRLRRGDRLALGDEQLLVCSGPRRSRSPLVAGVVITVALVVLAYSLVRRPPPPLEDLAASVARSVYLVTTEEGGQRDVIGTAFAVRADGLLATNAHVARELRQRGAFERVPARRGLAIRSDSPDDVRRVLDAIEHPDWRPGSLSEDVALLRLAPGAPVAPLPLADPAAFSRLRRGASLATFGFPVASTDPWKPRGRFSVDVAGDVRDDRYVEVGLGIAPGTSGSPILDADRRVVAIVTAGDFLPVAGRAALASGSAANWGISVAALRDLLNRENKPPREP